MKSEILYLQTALRWSLKRKLSTDVTQYESGYNISVNFDEAGRAFVHIFWEGWHKSASCTERHTSISASDRWPLFAPQNTHSNSRTIKASPGMAYWGSCSVSRTRWRHPLWFIPLAVWNVKVIITSEGLSSPEDPLPLRLPCRANGKYC